MAECVDGIVGVADLRVHAERADLGGDEMDVLAAEVENGDGVVLEVSPCRLRTNPFMPLPSISCNACAAAVLLSNGPATT